MNISKGLDEALRAALPIVAMVTVWSLPVDPAGPARVAAAPVCWTDPLTGVEMMCAPEDRPAPRLEASAH